MTLLVQPDPPTGLQPEHLTAARTWATNLLHVSGPPSAAPTLTVPRLLSFLRAAVRYATSNGRLTNSPTSRSASDRAGRNLHCDARQ